MRRRGFTLIEVLVTIGIIVILASIVLVATRSITTGAKKNATQIALENCKSLLAEYATAKKLESSGGTWAWWDGSTNQFFTSSAGPDVNFWLKPTPANVPPEPKDRLPLDAPGYVRNDPEGKGERNGSRAVLNTTVAMGLIAAIPANRTALLKLPQDQVFLPEWVSVTDQFNSAGADRVRNSSDDGVNGDSACYPVGCRIRNGASTYRCAASHTTGATFTTANWQLDGNPVPIMRDGWGNPIIFVPATGLNVRLIKDQSKYDPTVASQSEIITAPDRRPFWASAGPDGDFSKGDDNLYSFE